MKFNIDLLYDHEATRLRTYLQGIKAYVLIVLHKSFTAALVIISINQKQDHISFV